ncbi:MAG: hypothetical protein RMX68_009150 [Aulosira sp. ZfuVER01]
MFNLSIEMRSLCLYNWGDVCLEKFRSAEAAAPTFRYDGLRLRI